MTNFQLARILENQYDEWLAEPKGWPYSVTFKKMSSQRWVVREIVDRLKRNSHMSPNYICQTMLDVLSKCCYVRPDVFRDAKDIMEDIYDFITTIIN